jgi:hypothetical protein
MLRNLYGVRTYTVPQNGIANTVSIKGQPIILDQGHRARNLGAF